MAEDFTMRFSSARQNSGQVCEHPLCPERLWCFSLRQGLGESATGGKPLLLGTRDQVVDLDVSHLGYGQPLSALPAP